VRTALHPSPWQIVPHCGHAGNAAALIAAVRQTYRAALPRFLLPPHSPRPMRWRQLTGAPIESP
jgi:hypothetical protein